MGGGESLVLCDESPYAGSAGFGPQFFNASFLPHTFRSSAALIETIATFLAGGTGLSLVCISAFLSATLLPGSSEAILTAAIAAAPGDIEHAVVLAACASFFNTLGSMTSWAIGRFLPDNRARTRFDDKTLGRLRRWGAPALFLAWVPLIGDAIPLAAGWFRIGFWSSLFWTALGKSCRYAVLTWAALEVARRLG